MYFLLTFGGLGNFFGVDHDLVPQALWHGGNGKPRRFSSPFGRETAVDCFNFRGFCGRLS
jgi:hypothetical protein